MCKNCRKSESFSPCPPLNARLLHGEEIMCGEWRWRWRWRWDGDAETVRVVSVTRLVSTLSRLRKNTVTSTALTSISVSDEAGHLPNAAPPSANNSSRKDPESERPIHPRTRTRNAHEPRFVWRCGFFPTPPIQAQPRFYKIFTSLEKDWAKDVLAVPVLCLCC